MKMNTPWMSVACVCAAVALLAGCASRPVAKADAQSEARVAVSAKYVRIEGELPEAKGALAFLADDAALRAGKVVLTREQAEAALKELAWLTGQKVELSPQVTVVSGRDARIGIGFDGAPIHESASGGVKITVGGVEQDFKLRNVGVELEVSPLVLADGLIQLHANMQVTRFDGFVKYSGSTEGKSGTGESVKVPAGFYQPVFSTAETAVDARLASDTVVVLRADDKGKREEFSGKKPLLGHLFKQDKRTLLIFLTAKTFPLKGR